MVQFESSTKHCHTILGAQINDWIKHVPLSGVTMTSTTATRLKNTDQGAFAARSRTYSQVKR